MKLSMTRLVLLASLAVLWVRGLEYAWLGSFTPLLFAATATALLLLAFWAGGAIWRWSVRLWGVVLVLYGLVRLALSLMVRLTDVGSPHAVETTGVVFMGLSVVWLVAGVWIVRARISVARAD